MSRTTNTAPMRRTWLPLDAERMPKGVPGPKPGANHFKEILAETTRTNPEGVKNATVPLEEGDLETIATRIASSAGNARYRITVKRSVRKESVIISPAEIHKEEPYEVMLEKGDNLGLIEIEEEELIPLTDDVQ